MRTTLRAGLYAGGAVATLAGLHTAIAGARSLPGEERANPAVESELRYYGAFYAAYGIAVLRVAPRADTEPAAVRALAGAIPRRRRPGRWLARRGRAARGAARPARRGAGAAAARAGGAEPDREADSKRRRSKGHERRG
jgi:hypothetical protein